jgi:hypothetical protein
MREADMAGARGIYRIFSFLVGAGLLYFANRYAVFLFLSWGLTSATAACVALLFIYGCLFLLCDWLKVRTEARALLYFFFRGACLGALYLTPYIASVVAVPTGSSVDVAVLFIVGAIIVFGGHLLTRIMFSAAEERGFYRWLGA